ncbi:MAG TPA: flagellar biosynthesis protein FlhF [Melioribacteraceae bacterium]|nr:flagellar biosynthesis protein FlhF [Melioribacteraceae bacterium]
MQIKKFLAPTLKEATEQMKSELGNDAVILGTRVIEGDRRFNVKKMFEITAGLDRKTINKPSPALTEKLQAKPSLEIEIEKLQKKIFKDDEPAKKIIDKKLTRKLQVGSDIEFEIKELGDVLTQHEVQKNIVKELTSQLENYDGIVDPAKLEGYLISGMASLITTKEFNVKKNKLTKVALVGPTGVGKTTCIAKLAIISKIIHKLKVGLISIDTYRLGAIDQLRIFSEISDIEMAVAYEPEEMPRLLKKFKDKDLVFIDTIGRSQRNADNLSGIKAYLDTAEPDETVLVASSTTSSRTLIDISQKFKPLDYSSVIFTKVDEAVSYGNILNFVYNSGVPVMFLTNGQVIPDDIISVNPELLANLVFSGKLY